MHQCSTQILSKTLNGKIFICKTCDKIHIEFNNLNFVFAPEEFKFFRNYFKNLNEHHWKKVNEKSQYDRKIMIPIGHRNFTMLFHVEEIQEMRQLLGNYDKKTSSQQLLQFKSLSTVFELN